MLSFLVEVVEGFLSVSPSSSSPRRVSPSLSLSLACLIFSTVSPLLLFLARNPGAFFFLTTRGGGGKKIVWDIRTEGGGGGGEEAKQ